MGTFSDILGNGPVLGLLEGALVSDEVGHAYLFHGPPGVGKRTVARRFGVALVSGGDAGAADRALRGLHPDLDEVEPEGQFTTIGQVREVLRRAASRPFEGARRVFILEADTLNVQAANALLKTLEEPEGEAVFILLAASREGVIPTVASRAQAVRFDPVPLGEVSSFLMRRGHAEDEARLAAALGRGSVGLALRYAEEEELKELREDVVRAGFAFGGSFEERYGAGEGIVARAERVGAAREKAYLASFGDAEGAAAGGAAGGGPDRRVREAAKRLRRAARDAAVAEALGLLAFLYRDAVVVEAGAADLAVNTDRLEEIRARVAERPGADWAAAARELGEARASLAYNVSPEAIVEVALSRTRQKILGVSLESSPGS